MFDLIDESGKDLTQYGYNVKALPRYGASLAYLNVDSPEKSKRLAFAMGEYFIINAPTVHEEGERECEFIQGVLTNALKQLFKSKSIKKSSRVLLVGLGNPDILADNLGKAVLDGVEADVLNKSNRLYKICPNIYPVTGIDTFEFVKLIAAGVNAEAVIIVDSLATNEITRLATSFQLTSVGLAPGSGVNKKVRRICEEELGVPCISIGVPLMCFARGLNADAPEELILTPKDIHENLYTVSYIIGKALNEVLN